MYSYTFIRTDLPLHQQLVQACHSAYQAGAEHLDPTIIPNLILLESHSENHLLNIRNYLDSNNIKYHMFYEPDDEMGYSSITTEPLQKDRKKLMSAFKLWGSK